MFILYSLTYISVLSFFIMICFRFIRISTSPIHLRWELYPVPSEKNKSKHGGSKLEEIDWWKKKHKKSIFNEIKVMFLEIFLLKGVWEHNRELWYGSFPFHFGLYLLILNMLILIKCSMFSLFGFSIMSESHIYHIYVYKILIALMWTGSITGMFGSIRLFLSRIVDSGLSLYNNLSHYFNIILIGAIYCSLYIWLLTDYKIIDNLIGFYIGFATFSAIPSFPLMGIIHIAIVLLFIFYLPLTHMTHFFTKYFTYHKVRWEDEGIEPGTKIAERLSRQLNQTVTWAAPHIGSDGKKTWIALAASQKSKGKDNE